MIGRLTEIIQRGVNEETSSASISYLPGAFASTKSLVNDLSRIKKMWNVEVLEEIDGYRIVFEDALNIVVPKQYFEDFNTNVVKVSGVTQVDLTATLNEAIKEVTNSAYGRLLQGLSKDLKKNEKIVKTTSLMNYWLQTYKNSKFVPSDEKVAIRLNSYDNDATALAKHIEKTYGDDIGSVDMVVDGLENGRSAGQLEGYDYLAGVKIHSVHQGVNIILEMNINASMVPSQSIYVDSEEVTDALESYRTVRTLYRTVFPVGQMFEPSIFGNIKDIVDGVKENE